MLKGKQSICFKEPPYIVSHASVAGKKEGEGPLGQMFDFVEETNLFGQNTWEEAESEMQKEACLLALAKANKKLGDIHHLFGGDLLRQGVATSMGLEVLEIPLFGLFGACSTSGESIALASMSVAAGYGDYVMAVTSSHFATAEKEFRFPLAYANQRPLSAQWTVTGSGAFVIGKQESHVKITGITIGKIVDYGLHDSQNMGACMAPAACNTLVRHMKDFGRIPKDYDRIFTGDLGYVGQSILIDLVKKEGYDIIENHHDCGMLIFEQQTQDTHSGGSGCGCAATTLSAYIFIVLIINASSWFKSVIILIGSTVTLISIVFFTSPA